MELTTETTTGKKYLVRALCQIDDENDYVVRAMNDGAVRYGGTLYATFVKYDSVISISFLNVNDRDERMRILDAIDEFGEYAASECRMKNVE